MFKKLTLAIFATIGLAACQGNSAYYGKGPVTLSPFAQAVFEDYLTKNGSTFFVTVDGEKPFYRYCPEVGNCRTDTLNVGLNNCEEHWGTKCAVYAVRKDIVWQFDVDPNQPTQ